MGPFGCFDDHPLGLPCLGGRVSPADIATSPVAPIVGLVVVCVCTLATVPAGHCVLSNKPEIWCPSTFGDPRCLGPSCFPNTSWPPRPMRCPLQDALRPLDDPFVCQGLPIAVAEETAAAKTYLALVLGSLWSNCWA